MSEPEGEPPAAPQSDSEVLAEVRDLLTEIRDAFRVVLYALTHGSSCTGGADG